MPTTTLPTDLVVQGNLAAQSMSVPAGAVANSQVAAAANIDASKLNHAHRVTYAQESATAVANGSWVMHVVVGATGTIQAFKAGSVVVAIGAATATVDLRKNGTTVLSAVITLDTGNSARVAEAGTVTSASVVAGDVLEVVIVGTAGGGTLPKGLFAVLDIFENPS